MEYPHFRKHPYRIFRLAATYDFCDSPEGWKDLSGATLVFWDVADEIDIIWHISEYFLGDFAPRLFTKRNFPTCFFLQLHVSRRALLNMSKSLPHPRTVFLATWPSKHVQAKSSRFKVMAHTYLSW